MRERLGDRADAFLLPPSAFESMEGEFVSFDHDQGALVARFPVRSDDLNAYGTMQGGVIAAAVDNTLGPLSLLVAPPNYTRHLELTYSRPVTPDLGHILVRGVYLGRDVRWLAFRAEVRDPQGKLLARARARHWVLEESSQ